MFKVEKIELNSVGIDVGSSTSHLIFSKLILKRDNNSPSRRFRVAEREIIYEGKIIDTPLIDSKTIDIPRLVAFFREEYKAAGFEDVEKVDTGAVIVTGETAKKHNANEIVELLSGSDSGKFVSATAGPNFESLLAALGSGATHRSKIEEKSILSADIGGGTSNMAISKNGKVVSTSCINIGGRLLAFDKDGKIWRIDEPTNLVMAELGMNYHVGDNISLGDIRKIAGLYADTLIEVISGPAMSDIAKQLMMTTDLDFSFGVDEISFSGGVAEFLYDDTNGKLTDNLDSNKYRDMGMILADEISKRIHKLSANVSEPESKIRATVIGAGAYSLSISGSTCFFDGSIEFPLRNIPVVDVGVQRTELSKEHVRDEIERAYERFDLVEGEDMIALFFNDPVRVSYEKLTLFAKSIESALPNSVKNNKMIILIFDRDIGNSVGNVIRRETAIKDNLICLDELDLNESDWIDIGEPLISGEVFPVTVKSLVFNKNLEF